MNGLWLLQEAAHDAAEAAGEHAAEPNVFNLTFNVSFWTLVIFLLLLWALKKYAFPPILGYAQAREDRIREVLAAAARDREEASRLLDEQRAALGKTRDEASQILAEAKIASESVRQEIVEKAHAEHAELLERARGEIEREREKAVDAVRATAVELALAATSKLLGQKVQGETDRRFVQDVIERTGRGGVA